MRELIVANEDATVRANAAAKDRSSAGIALPGCPCFRAGMPAA
jgi:hypothetical protein